MAQYIPDKKHTGTAAGAEQSQVVVVMVPCWLQGHLNQLLHLSRLVAAHNIPVHYVCTPTHNRQVQERVHGFNPLTITNLYFHDLPTPTFPSLSSEPNTNQKFPSHFVSATAASLQMRQPVFDLLKKISATARRIVVVYDPLIAYVVQDVQSIENTESFCFVSISAFTLFSVCWEFLGKPEIPDDACFLNEVPSSEGCFSPEFQELTAIHQEANMFHSGNIFNSNRVIEGLYVDLFDKMKFLPGDKLWALGPFNPVNLRAAKEDVDSESRHRCLVWLDKQPLHSVILVSFGTASTLSNEQIRELALGLERSGHKFIWLLKEADKGDIFTGEARTVELPEGLEERVKERGVVVRDWAPQLEILGHRSTGGFMSHYGWNSCMESMSIGVPIATWPMHSDQPRNAILITKVLKLGVQVLDWERRDELVSSSVIEAAVTMLMGSGDGDDMRQRAKQLAHEIKKSVMDEDGITRQEISEFINHITRKISLVKMLSVCRFKVSGNVTSEFGYFVIVSLRV